MTYFTSFHLTAIALLASTSSAALAQTADDAAPAENGQGDIVVTAQRRSESLRDVPIAVTAFSADSLARSDIRGLQEVFSYTPNMTFNQSSGTAQIYLRGVGSNIANFSTDGSVAVNVDGVYVARPFGALNDFLDVDHIEILRGPQGTLYGRNATAGAINIISKRPTRELSGYVRGIYGSFDRRELQGAIGGALTSGGNVRARIAGRWARDDGFTKDLDPRGSNKLDNQNVNALRGTLDGDFGPLAIQLTADYLKQHSNGDTVRVLDGSGYADQVGAPLPWDFHSARNNLPTYNDNRTFGFTGQATYDLGGASLVSVTGYRELRQHFLLNTDGTEADVSESIFYTNAKQFSQELRLQSNGDGPLRWLAGAYYFHEKVNSVTLLPRLSGMGTRPFPYSTIFIGDGTTNAYAGFVDGTYSFTAKLSFSAGIRYSKENKSLHRELYAPGAVIRDVFDRAAFGSRAAVRDDSPGYDAWTPRFVLNYRPSEDALFYLSASRGFKSGGANIAATTSAPFNNELLWSYEAGAKISFLARKAFWSAAIFRYDYSNLQVTTFQNGLNAIQNAASANPWGVESELSLKPSPALELKLSAAYLEATYDKFISSLGGVAVDASGNRMIGAPKWTLSGSANYVWDLGSAGSLGVFGAVNYRSATDFNQFNFATMRQSGYALVDGRVSWTAPRGGLSISGFVKNLFDKDYVRNIAGFTSISAPAYLAANPQGSALGYPGPGRQLGVEVGYRF